jgi:CRISPR-associated protein Cas5h
MRGLKFKIKGKWGHFKIPHTNNNPQTYSIIPKTAVLGIIGAVCGIDRIEMKTLYPLLSKSLEYSVVLNNRIEKVSKSLYTTNLSNYNDKRRENRTPKPIELIKNVDFDIILILKGDDDISMCVFDKFKTYIEKNISVYNTFLGQTEYFCDIEYISYDDNIIEHDGVFETNGFVDNVKLSKSEIDEFDMDSIIYTENIPISQTSDWFNDKYKDLKFSNKKLLTEGKYIIFGEEKYFTI